MERYHAWSGAFEKGIICRIVNGQKIRIWQDNWAPRGYMKITNNVNNSSLRRVAQLINQEEHTWNENLAQSIFAPFDVEEIIKIYLPNYEEEDFVSWTLERHELFTVRNT
jgi:hypothetical protein